MNNEQVQKWELYDKIVGRAESIMGRQTKGLNRLSLLMDIELADQKFKLRLQEWLDSDNDNFAHDWIGIQKNINRQNKTFEKHFIPRFAQGGN